MVHRLDQRLDAGAFLHKGAVVFGHGADAKGFGVFGDAATALRDAGQRLTESADGAVLRQLPRRIVAQGTRAEQHRVAQFALNALDFFIQILVQEIRCHGVVAHADPCVLGLLTQLFAHFLQRIVPQQHSKVDLFKAHLRRCVHNVIGAHASRGHRLMETVTAHADFHDEFLLFSYDT